jgi:hypothetical protein
MLLEGRETRDERGWRRTSIGSDHPTSLECESLGASAKGKAGFLTDLKQAYIRFHEFLATTTDLSVKEARMENRN